MLIAQISDFHVKAPGSRALPGIDTAANLAGAVRFLLALRPRPEVILATGDLVAEGRAEEYAILHRLLAPLDPAPYLIPGNHDDRGRLRAAFAEHGYLPSGDGFLHYVVDDHPVRLIGLDSLAPGRIGGRLCAERLSWLEARLAEAPARPTLVFMHHPPFRSAMPHLDARGCEGAAALGAILSRHDQVARLLCGHIHRPIATLWHGILASTCPSTAAQMALELRPGAPFRFSAESPACQLHLWRPDTGFVSHTVPISGPDPE